MSVVDIDPNAWQTGAACRDRDIGMFFPDRHGSLVQAQPVCAACPVVERCREMVDRTERNLVPREVYGYFAGETPSQRVRLRRRPTG